MIITGSVRLKSEASGSVYLYVYKHTYVGSTVPGVETASPGVHICIYTYTYIYMPVND